MVIAGVRSRWHHCSSRNTNAYISLVRVLVKHVTLGSRKYVVFVGESHPPTIATKGVNVRSPAKGARRERGHYVPRI